MRRSALAALLVAVSLPVLATAPAPAQETTAARQAFIDAADKICGAANARLGRAAATYERHVAVQTSGAGTKNRKVAKPADVAEFVRAVAIKELESQLKQLRLTVAPKGDAKAWSELLGDAEKALARLKARPDRAAFDDPFAQVSKDFRAFGFGACGQSGR